MLPGMVTNMDKLPEINKLKKRLAAFLGIGPAEVTSSTVIDRRAVKGSIMVHRMYSILAREGFDIPGGKPYATFGDLVRALSGGKTNPEDDSVADKSLLSMPQILDISVLNSISLAVGIDIEMVANMPIVNDFREDSFYRQNFSEREIAYCILQQEPRQSLAGKFCAKEAIIKADNSWKNTPFNQIEILNSADGNPRFKGFSLSISHTPDYAIAIALKG